jgi:hypothetical protein
LKRVFNLQRPPASDSKRTVAELSLICPLSLISPPLTRYAVSGPGA